ncbi:hypothetical protein XOC_0699 [Xanthomonas oryzae pv. oryzicola BLS256]|uniref:Uncharacterized protein n=1 Tax=Xanthomonas oryzae pv. oryzicola (strain BLS256) TaxID=383407 RepID=G7TCC0_XANOB|nr:hypothetical protein XOC_0699 [Xanthomonas oryzae pv. oryzicola BLS256]QEO99237.1 hypothetical protein XOCgx_4250 [Xanthomonas oryzae pv. oryzicola]
MQKTLWTGHFLVQIGTAMQAKKQRHCAVALPAICTPRTGTHLHRR